jgi:cobalt/nickel transport system permease protein
MHIPDGYLSPVTVLAAYGAAVPFWYQASKRVKKVLQSQAAPLVALFAAFSFTIQMFNLPVPGGTTAHAVGGTLVAVVLGPWAAVVAVSTALIIQAVFFGDGGITAIGANAFNMGIVLPMVGYAVYRLLAGTSPSPKRRTIAATVGGYVGINAAALLVGLELGIQPLFWSEGGRALYNPYGLQITVPAMMLTHLTIVGFAEAAFTGLVVAYLGRTHPELFAAGSRDETSGRGFGKLGAFLLAILGLLVVLTPLGLLARGSADFEWGKEELMGMLGYVPSGIGDLGSMWTFAPLRDYQMQGSGVSFWDQAPGYLLSAVVGIALIFAAVSAARLVLSRRAAVSE